MNPFQSLYDYEIFTYTLQQNFPSILISTLIIVQEGPCVATVEGQLIFRTELRLAIRELITFEQGTVQIEDYSYEFWRGNDKFAWYDSQPHPNDASLAGTYPHHKHVQPNIKQNRIPAPNIHFDQPNLLTLIKEIEEFLNSE